MARNHHARRLPRTEEAVTVLFCLIDDAYARLNPKGWLYESLKKLSDSEVLTLALFQQLRGVESQRSFLRDAERFFSHLFPGVAGLHPSSFHRRLRRLRRFLANRVPVSYELTPANVAEVRLTGELLDRADLGDGVARELLGNLAYQSGALQEKLAEAGILLVTERSRQGGKRQQAEIAFAALKCTFGLKGTLAKTLVGLATRIAAKVTAYTYAFLINGRLGRPQGRIKDLWA